MNNNDYIGDNNIRVVKLMIRNRFEDILVLRRSKTHPTYQGYPDLPGGRVQDGESDEDALWRKLQEETGLLLTTDKAVMISEQTLPIFKRQTATYALYALKGDFDNPKITLDKFHDGYEWESPKMLGDFDPPLQASIDDARDFFLPEGEGAPWQIKPPTNL